MILAACAGARERRSLRCPRTEAQGAGTYTDDAMLLATHMSALFAACAAFAAVWLLSDVGGRAYRR